MKISQELLHDLSGVGPVKPEHIMEYLPSLKVLRGVVPPIISTEDLGNILKKHGYLNQDAFPEIRIRFMLYINHYIRIRTDPEFLSTEAALAHKTTGTNPGGDRVAQIRDMTYAAESLKKHPATTTTADFLEWHDRVNGSFYTLAHDGRPIVTWCRKRNRWYITHEKTPQLFYTKSLALGYARERFLSEYQTILGEEYHGNTVRV